jgi:di/tricarboxylate transporter
VAYTAANASGIDPLVPALLVYTATAAHYFLPFHHMNVLVGVGENAGKYGDAEILRLGVPLALVVVIVTVLVEIPWWHLTGLIK